jgi:protein-disulfide isomerase
MNKSAQTLVLIGALMTFHALCPQVIKADDTLTSNSSDVVSSQAVASVGGSKITLGEIQKAQPDEIAGAKSKILSAKYALFTAERAATMKVVDEKLLADEAAKEHLTTDALLKKHVDDQIKDPGEEALRIYYLGAQTNMPFADARPKIIEHVRKLEYKKGLEDYTDSLRKAADVKVTLLPPRLEVAAGNSPSEGGADAPITLIEFADYQCPYCHQMEPTLASIREQYGDRIRFVYKDFPLPMHQYAQKAAEAALCAGEQGQYWPYHDRLFAGTTPEELQVPGLKKTAVDLKLDTAKFDACLDGGTQAAVVTQNINEGKAFGLSGTPTILINGYFLSGVVPKDVVTDIIDVELAKSAKTTRNESGAPKQVMASAMLRTPATSKDTRDGQRGSHI